MAIIINTAPFSETCLE
uniref:Uncharacterized protein n=1 Tax=Anguilla anguilla TaxID=7936 RepID=A0A0E9QCV2_ANGAN